MSYPVRHAHPTKVMCRMLREYIVCNYTQHEHPDLGRIKGSFKL